MKIFWPLMRHEPSPAGSALVRTAPTSLPACGSVRFIVPGHSPVSILGRYVWRSSSDPWCETASIAPCVSSGHSDNAMLALVSISCMAIAVTHGKPPPPNSGSNGTAP